MEAQRVLNIPRQLLTLLQRYELLNSKKIIWGHGSENVYGVGFVPKRPPFVWKFCGCPIWNRERKHIQPHIMYSYRSGGSCIN